MAFQHLNRAHSINSYNPEVRKNLLLSYAGLTTKASVQISPDAFDKLLRRAESAARYSPAVLMIKAEYLLKTKRQAEAEAVFLELQKYAPKKASAWLARVTNG